MQVRGPEGCRLGFGAINSERGDAWHVLQVMSVVEMPCTFTSSNVSINEENGQGAGVWSVALKARAQGSVLLNPIVLRHDIH